MITDCAICKTNEYIFTFRHPDLYEERIICGNCGQKSGWCADRKTLEENWKNHQKYPTPPNAIVDKPILSYITQLATNLYSSSYCVDEETNIGRYMRSEENCIDMAINTINTEISHESRKQIHIILKGIVCTKQPA